MPTAGEGAGFLTTPWRITIAGGLILACGAWGFYVALNPQPRRRQS